MIDVQRLRVLRAVAEHGSFNRAAAALLLTPSAVSQHIAALERSLGAAVVTRSTRGVTLTEPGRVMVDAAEAVTAELARARARVDRLAEARPRLTVATFTSGGRVLLPGALTRFAAEHPQADLTVLEREPEDSLRLVCEGAADLALAYHFEGPLGDGGPDGRPGLVWTPLLDDPLSAVLPDDHPLAARPSVDLAELAAERWVLGCLKTEAYLRRYAALAGFEPVIRGTTTDYFFARSLVAARVGVSLVPSVALTPELPGVSAVPVLPPALTRRIGMATASGRHGHPLAEALAGALRAEAGGFGPAAAGGPPGPRALTPRGGDR
ncbi:LysR family transcriptional regulator [Streptomyces spectabilis]|uniref:LysR family transcriptional regulator n=1 Tax=Streptomyces spectabilis TaxID=68270 RepID=A0A516RH20_STRST|nr:LysR family transcriptional regulator [Streptomyces spectabilis]QDQ14952.1 LysR family transcriptional regulator [Streptomyces spectabilis]